jgi:hypothetical protein
MAMTTALTVAAAVVEAGIADVVVDHSAKTGILKSPTTTS